MAGSWRCSNACATTGPFALRQDNQGGRKPPTVLGAMSPTYPVRVKGALLPCRSVYACPDVRRYARVLDRNRQPLPDIHGSGNENASPIGGGGPAADVTLEAALTLRYIAGIGFACRECHSI
jgi:hypothetical protein